MKNNSPDYVILASIGAIIFFGLFILASAASVGSQVRFFEQLLLGFLPGAILGFVLYKIPLSTIQKLAPYFLLGNIILLLLILFPFFSETARGATRWFALGPISFQPAEFLKLSFLLYIASWLSSQSKKRKRRAQQSPTKDVFLPFLAISFTVAVLLGIQPDLSTLIIILSTGFIVYFVAKTPLWHTLALFGFSGAGLLVTLALKPYQLARITSAFNPDLDPLGATYQLRQALVTVGSGGIFGLGIGMSQQKFGFLPFPASDSIFAILAEETGFIGSILLLSIFLIFFYRGFMVAKNNKNGFARLVSIGICSWIFLQTSINIGVMTGLLPVTGIPLPFISYGKSHLIAEMAAVGVLLNTSRYVRR